MNNSIIERLEFETGRLIFKDVRYMLIRPDVLISLQKSIEAELGPEKCLKIMMAAGNLGGRRSSQRFKEAFGYGEREIVEFMCGMGGEIGWGVFSLVELAVEAGTMIIEVTDSPYAAVYGPSETPVCHLIRGVLAGLGAGVFEADVRSDETACAAAGAPACRFEVRRR
jgi:predicted hydrocarbon binding protein